MMNRKLFLSVAFAFSLTPVPGVVQAQNPTADIPAMTGQTAGKMHPMPSINQLLADEGDYYLVRGKKIYLRRNTQQMVVKFTSDSSNRLNQLSGQASQSAFLKQNLNSANMDAELTVEKQLSKNGLALIRTTFKTQPAQLLSRADVQEVAQSPSVEYAYPVFTSKNGINAVIATDEILVRFTPGFSQGEIQDFAGQHDLTVLRNSSAKLNIHVLAINNPDSRSPLTVANALNSEPGVVWSQPNFIKKMKLSSVNDTLYNDQWHLENTGQGGIGTVADADVDAEGAWADQTASPDITIAIIDDGIDLNHADLDIWINPGEIAGNGVDDDGNGYIDDVNGWNFYDDNNTPDADFDNNHGTACAGVAAARGNNNLGVAGIAYGAKVLPLKIFGGIDGAVTTDEKTGQAILYAADQADIISCSWGGGSESTFINDAIDYAVTSGRGGKGTPVFVATGNGAARGWAPFTITGFPAGDQAHGWQYNQGAESFGADAAWVDQVTLQDGSVETFDGLTALPTDWSTFGDALWGIETDPAHAYGQVGNSVKSGTLAANSYSTIYVKKNYASAGYYSYHVKVDGGEGSRLYAMYWNGTGWQAYKIFYGKHIDYPASYSNAIAVGASTDADIQSYYSQYGNEIDFVAPSNGGIQGITTTDRTGAVGYTGTDYTNSFGGTSSATPLAAGIGALLLSKNSELTANEIRTIMRNSCDKIGNDAYDNSGSGWNVYYGYGRVNAMNALAAVADKGLPALTPIYHLLLLH
jgi:subtilisin family serine protease